MVFDWWLAFGLALSAVLAAGGGVLLLAAWLVGQRRQAHGLFTERLDEVCFLFDDETLLDATPAARAMLQLGTPLSNPLPRLIGHLSKRFPQLPEHMENLAKEGRFLLTSTEGEGRQSFLQVDLRGGITRFQLFSGDQTSGFDALTQIALEDELALLRGAVSRAPYLTWRQDQQNRIIWANTAYLQ